MAFKILKKSKKSKARLGIIETLHGPIRTPAFIPVGTKATVKGVTIDQLKSIGSDALLCNTYHLYLKPGDELIKKHGGLHGFMKWNKPIFTDSGGFQVFSLGLSIEHGVGKIIGELQGKNEKETFRGTKNRKPLVKVTDEGVAFQSFLDGSRHFFTPEKSIKIQENLGADIIIAFDECPSPLSDYDYTKKAMERTHAWAARSLKAFKNKKKQELWGVVQGGEFKDLREISAKYINSLNFSGFAIGGFFGKSKKTMYQVLNWTNQYLDENKPKHLLGIGKVEDIIAGVKAGLDTFDCVIPTRLGRNGTALINKGELSLRSSKFLTSKDPISKTCRCYTCSNKFSRGYLSHLVRGGEMLAGTLITLHNLTFMEDLMASLRDKIKHGLL